MAPKLRAERTQPHRGSATVGEHESPLAKTIRAQLESHLNGRKLLSVKIRRAEGRSIEGFLKIEGWKGERLLVDFKATGTEEDGLSALEVDGRKIALTSGPAARRTH